MMPTELAFCCVADCSIVPTSLLEQREGNSQEFTTRARVVRSVVSVKTLRPRLGLTRAHCSHPSVPFPNLL